jgi:hypothetical protein
MTTISFEVDIDLFVTSRLHATCRSSALCSVTRRNTPHRNDLFVTPLRNSGLRHAARLNSTICLLQRCTPHLGAPRRYAPLCVAIHLTAIQLNDLFVTSLLNATRLASTRRGSLPLASTQRFVCHNASPRGSALHWAPRLPAAHLASTQRFVCYIAAWRNALQRNAMRRIAPQL